LCWKKKHQFQPTVSLINKNGIRLGQVGRVVAACVEIVTGLLLCCCCPNNCCVGEIKLQGLTLFGSEEISIMFQQSLASSGGQQKESLSRRY